jgi:hypothetical protein
MCLHRTRFLVPALLACTVVLFLAPLGATLAATASNLVCKSCVGSTDLANRSVTSTKLGSNSVDGSKIKNRSIGNADLAVGSVNSNTIADGSVCATDLHASLIARIEALEAALGTQPDPEYTLASLQGTYRCQSTGTEAAAYDNGAGDGFAGMTINTTSIQIISNGAGGMTFSRTDHWYWQSWNVVWYQNPEGGGWRYLGHFVAGPETVEWETVDATYTVSAQGAVDISINGETALKGPAWLSHDGDLLMWTELYQTFNAEQAPVGQQVTSALCVRTSTAANPD